MSSELSVCSETVCLQWNCRFGIRQDIQHVNSQLLQGRELKNIMEFFVGKKILIESECKRKSLTGLSLHLNGHFPGGPGLAATRMYPFWILLELRVMEVVVTTGAIRQSNCHHQQTNTQLFYRRDALPVTQPTVSKHWRNGTTKRLNGISISK